MDASTGLDTTLPAGFEDLATFVSAWALPTEEARYAKRLSADLDVLRGFHAAILPRMHEVMRHLELFPADDIAALPAPTRSLYRLALSYFEVSNPIELRWKGPDLDNAFPASRIVYQAPSNAEN
jgi:hypothetical protein